MITSGRKYFFITFLILTAAALCAVFCTGRPAKAASVDDNYYFGKVDVQITVNRDKTYSITETLDTRIKQDGINTGIIRDVQRVSATTRIIDGKSMKGDKYIAKLSDVEVTLDGDSAKVTQEYYKGRDFYSVKMQTPQGYLSAGTHTFVLKYLYGANDDKARGFDDFTFDVLGYAMAETKEFTARITFPQDADLSRVSFRSNGMVNWEPDTEKGEYATVSDNTVSIRAFPGHRGITVQTILPDGYFDASRTFFKGYIAVIIFTVLGVAAGVAMLVIGICGKKRVAAVEYTPPETDIMHVSAAWHKHARYKDIAALLLQWEAKGLIKIKKDGKKDLLLVPEPCVSDDIAIQAALDKMTFAERAYFCELFLVGGVPTTFSTAGFKKRIAPSKKRIYDCCEKLVESGDKNPKPTRMSGDLLGLFIALSGLIPSFAILSYFFFMSGNSVGILIFLFLIAGTFMAYAFCKSKIILMIIFPICFYGFLYGFFAAISCYLIYDYAYIIFFAPAWWSVCNLVLPFFVRGVRSKECSENYAKLCSFKRFLLYTELDRIQLMFDENPKYFSEILPYCLIMGISKKVQKRFAPLDFAKPEYFAEGLTERSIGSHVSHTSHSSGVSVFGGAFSGGGGGGGSSGGGSGGSSGGGGGGGGSRGC